MSEDICQECGHDHTPRPAPTVYVLPTPSGWRSIESAPKEIVMSYDIHEYGPFILVYDGGIPFRARWWRSIRAGSDASNFIADGGYAVHPTHWHPLPEPPQ